MKMIDVYNRLLEEFGKQSWWPADSPLEVMVGAVLTQNTSWKNVVLALENLRQAGALCVEVLHELPAEELAELIRPAGYYRLKARRLKNLIDFIACEYGDLETMFAAPQDMLRQGLLSVSGVGPETADSILLYAAEMPSFVVDTYTARVLKRHGWIEPEADYHAIQDYFQSELPAEVPLFNEFHALLVRVGNGYCRKTPKCEQCPLKEMLPAGGPCEM